MAVKETLVEVNNVFKKFPITRGLILEKEIGAVKAVDGVTLGIARGETLGLAGETGSGKTTLARCILQIYRVTSGNISFEGKDLCKLSDDELRPLRAKMQVIFQDPYGSLNPRMTCNGIVGEPLVIHKLVQSKEEFNERVAEILRLVGIDPSMGQRYPHMFSGGQRQRIGVARALASRPDFVICDEPVSALDVSIQAQVINLLMELKETLGLTYLFVAHDLSVLYHVSDRIAIMYLGKVMEIAPKSELYLHPLHPYTKALLSAVPIPDPVLDRQRQRIILEGEIPSPVNPPSGCTFHERCAQRKKVCSDEPPPLHDYEGHWVACYAS